MKLKEIQSILDKAIECKAVELFEKEYPDCWIPFADKHLYKDDVTNDIPHKHIDYTLCAGRLSDFILNPNLMGKYIYYKMAIEAIATRKLEKILIDTITQDNLNGYIL